MKEGERYMEKKNNDDIDSSNFLEYIEDEELNKDIHELNLARKKLRKRLHELRMENNPEYQNLYGDFDKRRKLIDYGIDEYSGKANPENPEQREHHHNKKPKQETINQEMKISSSENPNQESKIPNTENLNGHKISENLNQNSRNIPENRWIEFFNRNNTLRDRFRDAFSQNVNIDPGRLLALTDGIFGMVMTLLAFGIELPATQMKTSQDIFNFIVSTLPTVGTVLVSFILVSTFWVYHHEVIKLKNMDTIYLWLNILYLASLSFIPFTTSLMGSYGQYFLIECVFIINIFIITLLFTACVHYANNKNFLENTMDKSQRKYYQHTFAIISLLTFVVVLGDYFINSAFTYLLIITPFIFIITQLKHDSNS